MIKVIYNFSNISSVQILLWWIVVQFPKGNYNNYINNEELLIMQIISSEVSPTI